MVPAKVKHSGGREWSYECDTREQAALRLRILLRRDGWEGDPTPTLIRGEKIEHKRFTYWIGD